MKQTERGFTLIELMIVIAIIAVIAAIAIPGLLQAQRASNERSASSSLKTLSAAEVDFRSNDRDGNRLNDFWTFNLAGLFTLTSLAAPGNTDSPIKLIEVALASSDADGTPTGAAEDTLISTHATVSAKAGYWINALRSDASTTVPENYRTDTGGLNSLGAFQHVAKFGFTSWPDSPTSGKFIYIINESFSIFRRSLTSNIRPATTTPPGSVTTPFENWPTDAELKANWNKLD